MKIYIVAQTRSIVYIFCNATDLIYDLRDVEFKASG
jgi:hypothetical protein